MTSAQHKLVIKGEHFRVQLAAWDFREAPQFVIGGQTQSALNFSVALLPMKAHPSTSYRSCSIYYGPDLRTAVELVFKYTGRRPSFPRTWNEYLRMHHLTRSAIAAEVAEWQVIAATME